MNHSRFLHFGCLLALGLVFSGCVAEKQVTTTEQSKAKPAEKVVIPPSGQPEAAKPAKKVTAKPAKKAAAKAAPAAGAAAAVVEESDLVIVEETPASDSPLEHYSVKLSSNKTSVAVGESLSLYVQIEAPRYPLTGNEAHGVQVTFDGLGFAAEAPATECLRVHPTGSEVIYILKAANAGSYNVTANVSVFPTRDCATFSVRRSSQPVAITVE